MFAEAKRASYTSKGRRSFVRPSPRLSSRGETHSSGASCERAEKTYGQNRPKCLGDTPRFRPIIRTTFATVRRWKFHSAEGNALSVSDDADTADINDIAFDSRGSLTNICEKRSAKMRRQDSKRNYVNVSDNVTYFSHTSAIEILCDSFAPFVKNLKGHVYPEG